VAPGVVLSTAGVMLTTLITGAFVFGLSKWMDNAATLTFPIALLLAATMSSTDSASVFNLLRSQSMGLKHNLKPMLELESGSNDPMAYLLTLAFIGVVQTDKMSVMELSSMLVVQLTVGIASGYGFGKVTVWIMNKIHLSNTSLYTILLLAAVFITFSLTDMLGGNGYLAVYLAGIIVGNSRLVKKTEVSLFLDGLTWLFQIVIFLVLGLLVNPKQMLHVAPFALLVGVFLMLVARPLSVFLSLIPFKGISVRDKVFVSWVGLRGAVPIIFATYPMLEDIPHASDIFNVVFFITIISLLFQGTSIPQVARMLHLTEKMKEEGNSFGIIIPEENDSKVWEVEITAPMLESGNNLANMQMPAGILVMLVKRGSKTMVPDGKLELHVGDKLLLISAADQDEAEVLQS
jgi:potassium/hydrogen antiporter